MVALQILVLTVGVRILLGEKAARAAFCFENCDAVSASFALSWNAGFTGEKIGRKSADVLAPSNIGLVHRPLKAERWVRLPLELILQKRKFPQ